MKAKLFTFTSILLLFCTVAFVSCKKNADPDDPQEPATVKFDDATYIMGQFAEWDNDGNLLFRTKGYTLNEADDTEVSLCVETWDEALRMFKEWMPEEADYTETATSLTWRMTDGYGKSQGEAVLSKVTNGAMVGEAKLPSDIPFVRTIRFISERMNCFIPLTWEDICSENRHCRYRQGRPHRGGGSLGRGERCHRYRP